MKIERVGVYARVSTITQDTSNQLIELRKYVQARDWQAIEFVDHGMSGTKNEDQRPALKSLLQTARKRQIDAVVVWDFSRFARSMRQLVDALDNFRAWNIEFISLREGIDTSTANGRLMFGIFASIAEFERELIRERIMLGLSKARIKGVPLGRPVALKTPEKALAMRSAGRSLREIGSALGVGKSTIARLLSQNGRQEIAVASVETIS